MNAAFFFIVLSTFAMATARAETHHWVDEYDKNVVIALDPTLQVSVAKIDVDDQYYGVLSVRLSYRLAEAQQQLDEVMSRYPGYRAQKMIPEKAGTYRIRVPVLDIDSEIDPMPGTEGPWIEKEIYLSRKQYLAVSQELANQKPLVEISGQLIGTVPIHREVERRELESSICKKFLGSDRRIIGIVRRVDAALRESAERQAFRFESTRSSLERDIFSRCFELPRPTNIGSFRELVELPLQTRVVSKSLVGTTFQKKYERREVPLQYNIIASNGSER